LACGGEVQVSESASPPDKIREQNSRPFVAVPFVAVPFVAVPFAAPQVHQPEEYALDCETMRQLEALGGYGAIGPPDCEEE
jgi:hypothetical protein